MKRKFFIAALAALASLSFASAASADDDHRGYRGGYEDRGGYGGYDGRGGYGGYNRDSFTIYTSRGHVTVDRDDGRLFGYLASRPYGFRPGYSYMYADRCNRNGCVVAVFRGNDRYHPIDYFFAPLVPRWVDFHGEGGRWRLGQDRYWDERDWNDGRGWNGDHDRRWSDSDDRGRYGDDDRRYQNDPYRR